MSTTINQAYNDKGYLTLLAQEVLKAINGAKAVSLRDSENREVWTGPTPQDEPVHWDRLLRPGSDQKPGLKSFGPNTHVYVFQATGVEQDFYHTLCVYVVAADPIDYETAAYLLKPLLESLNRQLAINAELSAVRSMPESSRDTLSLLSELDEAASHSAQDLRTKHLLNLCLDHLEASQVAIVIPSLEIKEVIGNHSLPINDAGQFKVLHQLFTETRKREKILIAKTSALPQLKKMFGDAHLLAAPLNAGNGEIIGVLIVVSSREFDAGALRVARAISSKLAAVVQQKNADASPQLHRHRFLNEVDGLLKRHPHSAHAVLYFDIDKLHVINDSHGHMAGDEAIRALASVVSEFAASGDLMGHLTSDCFVLFLRNADEEKARAKAAAIIDTVRSRPLEYQRKLIEITVSVGIALLPDFASDASNAVNVSELAAKTAKDRGGNRLAVFQDLDASIIRRRSDLDQVGELQSALLEDRFVLYAQRIASLHNDNSNKFEILIRMLDERGNIVPPDKFLSAAERYQMMSAIDRWVLSEAIKHISQSDNMLEINLTTFCINVSGQSLADDDFLPYVERLVRESGLSPDSLCFEITETAIVRNLDRAQRFIQQLRKLGCRFALDDFGTGYCSFAYLKDLPVQYLKLDGAFVRDLLDDALSEAIVRSITHIGQVMGAATVAEHVENDIVQQKLRDLNVDYVQGYAIGRPAPLEEALAAIDDPIDLGLDALMQNPGPAASNQ